ncbi:GNAT family N-acetyltransferase [Vitreimonas flagellata]|uniref:GNAT family N-acetyltransferase n=1 Tax=Vitreimonas flagellata TaxID=2560861 RepID=UPI0010750D8A|nr:GNAT family N-acetyltransferase [Vitreimonas flagellata]
MHPLDKLAWTALTTRQAHLSEGEALARRFRTDIGPFASCADASDAAIAALAELIPVNGDISLLEPGPPKPPPGAALVASTLGLQMVWKNFSAEQRSFDIAPLGDADAAEMLELALLTKPGPFRARTNMLGRFVGIRDNGKLVAMAGERLQIAGFIEISGVCTHPDYRSRGYGAALMRTVGARIIADGETPFLHTYAHNTGAIALYQSLGFETRCEVTHAIWKRA